ncbi:hypothetical protein V1525DRAFT_393116 [Lipomyces kononenkoae]|uniref:Uncharacterized protein n=1 Tax=Lipomyces kononenkoae TaxID=34357 RepID=A0ACC3TD98_LIPKO
MSSAIDSHPPQVLWRSSYIDEPEKSSLASPLASPQPSTPSRRSSWIHNISHKFSANSSSTALPTESSAAVMHQASPRHNAADKRNTLPPLKTDHHKTNASVSVSTVSPTSDPAEPKSGFFSTLRRLSSSSRTGPSTECRRVVFNKNPSRPTCPVHELRCMKLKRVAFRVDEIDDEVITREPLYIQIRRVIKAQEAILLQKRQAIVASNAASTLDDKAALAGLDAAGSLPCGAKACLPDKSVLFLDGPVEIPKGVMAKIRNPALSTVEESSDDSSAASIQSNTDSDRRPSVASTASNSSSDDLEITCESSPIAAPDLGSVYVRCCKLRELRPLDYIYDQVKGHTGSLESLRLSAPGRDPPIFAQVAALADLLAFVPVEHFYMDNVVLADDMVKALMASLLWSKHLKYLTLANTKLNAAGWKSVCYLVAMNKGLEHVDLSGIRRKHSEWAVLSKAVEARADKDRIEVGLTDADIPLAEMERIKA